MSRKSKQLWAVNFNQLFGKYRRRAQAKEIQWSLTKEQFAKLTQGSCYLCGKKPSQVFKRKDYDTKPFFYNGIDRVDNSLGYTEENCQPCCGVCNNMKKTMTLDEFKEQVIKIAKVVL